MPGHGLILVIDDEPAVLNAATASLKQAGYDVVTAPDGESGLEVFAQHREHIRLVLLDLTMPGLSGDQVLGQLQVLAPGFPVIVMSGYSRSPLSTEAKH